MKRTTLLLVSLLAILSLGAEVREVPLLQNVFARQSISLNGKWNYIVDPFDNGYYDYRLRPMDRGGFGDNRKPSNPQELVEYNFDTSPSMDIPSDWNTKDDQLFFYEGSIWFKRDFTYHQEEG